MKKMFKLLGIITLVMLTGFVIMSCDLLLNGDEDCKNHEWGDWEEKDGVYESYCSKCGERRETETLPGGNGCKNHEWGLWQVKSDGIMERSCSNSNCNAKETATTLKGFTENTHTILTGLGYERSNINEDTDSEYSVGYDDVDEDDFRDLIEWLADRGFTTNIEDYDYWITVTGRGHGLEFNWQFENDFILIRFWVMPTPSPAVAEWAGIIKDFLTGKGAEFDDSWYSAGTTFLYSFSNVTNDMYIDLSNKLEGEGFFIGYYDIIGNGVRIELWFAEWIGEGIFRVSIELYTPPVTPPELIEWAGIIKDFLTGEGAHFDGDLNYITDLYYYFSDVNEEMFWALFDFLENKGLFWTYPSDDLWIIGGEEIEITILAEYYLSAEGWTIMINIYVPTGGAG